MSTIATWMPNAFSPLAPTQTLELGTPSLGRAKLVNDVHVLARRGQQLDTAAFQAETNRYITAMQTATRSREPGALSKVPPFDTTPTPAADQLIKHASDVHAMLQAFAAGDPAITAQIGGYLDAFATQLAPQGQEPGRTDPQAADQLWALAQAATQFMMVHTLAG